ncbi:hypothetical protein H5410_000527 [Solanum commersonii]|uniref:Uncharacterized protein n=1 Tax=Solanum commersonii TaxID=4109 RepID=A0A9J6AX08_SOLCO|nr:hypothetical protein H5410_000527 [Solanum commersonii]
MACFTWLVAREAVLTQHNLMKRRRQLCSRGISWSMPRHTLDFLACWNREGNISGHKERWKIVPTCIWWTIGRKGTRDASKTRASLSRV